MNIILDNKSAQQVLDEINIHLIKKHNYKLCLNKDDKENREKISDLENEILSLKKYNEKLQEENDEMYEELSSNKVIEDFYSDYEKL